MIFNRDYVNDAEIVELGKCHCGTIIILCKINGLTFTATNVEEFMAYYLEEFPQATVTPKLHILEDHMVSWLQRCKVGCGLLDEQGAESVHAKFNTL